MIVTYSKCPLALRHLSLALSLGGLLTGAVAQAQDAPAPAAPTAILEVPGPGTLVSGLGFISGWKCDAGEITVVIDERDPQTAVTRLDRMDTAGHCDNMADNGFLTQMNWNFLGAGEHTIVAYDDGEEFARATFTVGTTGEEFLEDVMGECAIADFPMPGDTATFVWNEGTQHLELSEVMAAPVEEMSAADPTDS